MSERYDLICMVVEYIIDLGYKVQFDDEYFLFCANNNCTGCWDCHTLEITGERKQEKCSLALCIKTEHSLNDDLIDIADPEFFVKLREYLNHHFDTAFLEIA